MALSYGPFLAFEQFKKAAVNAPWMKWGDRGDGVAMLQGALNSLGYRMPLTIRQGSVPDGKFGNETYAAIKQFQTDQKLKGVDGTAGRETLGRLDQLFVAKHPTVKKLAPKLTPKPIKSPNDSHYMLGSGDPHIKHDVGAGDFGSKAATVTYRILHKSLSVGLHPISGAPYAAAYAATGPNAIKHMRHYLGASGTTYRIDLENMVRNSAPSKVRYRDEVDQATIFVEKLPVGTHAITSKTGQSANNNQSSGTDWFFATGGYSSWGKGTAVVADGPQGKTFVLAFEYKFQDMYNWDGSKSVPWMGFEITDESMGEFHLQGLAKEFKCVGSFRRKFSWKLGEMIPESQYTH